MARPFVYSNMAITADGKITSATREYPRFTSAFDRRTMDRLRADADVLVVGAGTIRADDPPLHVRSDEFEKRPLAKVVVSASLEIPHDSRFFEENDGGRRILATVDAAPDERRRRIEGRAELWCLGARRVDLGALLERLASEGFRRALVEGGAELNWAMLEAGLVDEIYLTVAPALLGGRDAPTWLEGDGWPMNEQRSLKLLDVHREGDELYLRYAVERR